MKHSTEEIRRLCLDIKNEYPDFYRDKGYDLAKIIEELIEERDQAITTLKQAKKTLKKTLKAFAKPKNVEHKPEDCKYFTCGGCLGTKEIDPCACEGGRC